MSARRTSTAPRWREVRRTSEHRADWSHLPSYDLFEIRELLVRDCFKVEAIAFTYALLTEQYGLEGDRLGATVCTWTTKGEQPVAEGQHPNRSQAIQRLGKEDNFWWMHMRWWTTWPGLEAAFAAPPGGEPARGVLANPASGLGTPASTVA